MRQYEITYLISDKIAETEMEKVMEKVKDFIAEAKGKIVKEELWKRRRLAYPIKKQLSAVYVTLYFELLPAEIKALEHKLKIYPAIIRHLMIIRDHGTEALTLTAEEIADTKTIEEAVGGEQTFEAVVGETKESRELQAIRKAEEKEGEKDQPAEIKESPKTKEGAPAESEKPKRVRKKPVSENEADRLAKLDEQLDEILKEDL